MGSITLDLLHGNFCTVLRNDTLSDLSRHEIHCSSCNLIFVILSGIFRSVSLFMGGNVREAVNAGFADFVPIFLGETPLLFRRKVVNLDVALITLSPPDEHGFCSLGTSVDCTRSAIENARYIIGEYCTDWLHFCSVYPCTWLQVAGSWDFEFSVMPDCS